MRNFFIILVLVGCGALFVWQKQNQPAAVPQPTGAARQVSQHDWAKQSLDKAAKVKQDVLRHSRENQVP